MTDKIVTLGKVISRHDDAAAGFAPHVTQTIVGQVGDPGASRDINAAVCSDPTLGTQTRA